MKNRCLTILCLIAVLAAVFCPLTAAAEDDEPSAFPTRYDMRELGLVTEVKDQDTYGVCYAFTIANVLESSALMKGYGKYDLSEYQIAYLCTHIPPDQGPLIQGEGPSCQRLWLDGPYGGILSSSLMQGFAIQTEEDFPYLKIEEPLPDAGLSLDGALYVDSCYTVPASDTNAMKDLLMRNSALYMCIMAYSWSDDSGLYCDWNTGAAYLPTGTPGYSNVDHFVSVIGWDDNYSKENFKITPPGDGAWIIKNSWGTDAGDRTAVIAGETITNFGDGGCFYLSYYDAAFHDMNSASSITVTKERPYDRVYQYDGGVGLQCVDNVTDVLMRFTATEDESITGVRIKPVGELNYPSFFCGSWAFAPATATVRVYSGAFDEQTAADAEPVCTQEYAIQYPDYQTIGFDTEFALNKGEEYCVRVSFDRPIYYAIDGTQALFWGYQNIAGANAGETSLKIESDDGTGAWYDTADLPGKYFPFSACIKVLTKDRTPPAPEEKETLPQDTTGPEGGEPQSPDTTARASEEAVHGGSVLYWLLPLLGVLAVGAVFILVSAAKKRQD